MNFQIRKRLILETVERKGSVDVKELAQQLSTSEITVRRDLALLAEKGLLVRTHGGAVKVSLAKDPVSFSNKAAINQAEKEHICQLAAQQIQEGDTIFMDCGSTTFQLCQFIKHQRIRVVTNSLPVVYELRDSAVQINLAGGEVDRDRQAIHGTMVVEHLQRYRANKAFVGVDGISAANGLSANSEKEAQITLAMALNAHQVYLLCDSTKLEREKYFQFAPLDLIHALITDPNVSPEVAEKYRQAGLTVLY
ncbi:DeoR/GlpR family DNA-binding transcription regulator [Tellurirhabdus bombi]|uniref:DeoR/GlpR family DNA-binding transcription regulator n=1 Tax=Tellurirhabdus bombi TaxID=2907205 RepID=UPI001F1F837E|nr:DeoR/GlpR family DNA-binding transcription regulator [Tellurirhabdus bombi]